MGTKRWEREAERTAEMWRTFDRLVKNLEVRCEMYDASKRIHDSVWELRDALEGYQAWALEPFPKR